MTFSTRDFFDHNVKAAGSRNLNIIWSDPISHNFGLRINAKLSISILTPNKDFRVLKEGGRSLNKLCQYVLVWFSPWILFNPRVNPRIRLGLLLTRVWGGSLPKLGCAYIVQIRFWSSNRDQVIILLTAEFSFKTGGLDVACLVCKHVMFALMHVLGLDWV